MKPIMVSTVHMGVFGGLVPDDHDMHATVMDLDECRIADEWGLDDHVSRLATEGPPPTASISDPAPMTVQDVTMVWQITPQAWAKWEAGVWAPEGSRRGKRIRRDNR